MSRRHGPCWDFFMTSQLVRERDVPIWDVFATSHWYEDKTNQFETSRRHTNWHLSETGQINTSQRGHNYYLNEYWITGTWMRRNHRRCQKKTYCLVTPTPPPLSKKTPQKLTYFTDQFERSGPCWDIIKMFQLVVQ